jgi:hypothetical protein
MLSYGQLSQARPWVIRSAVREGLRPWYAKVGLCGGIDSRFGVPKPAWGAVMKTDMDHRSSSVASGGARSSLLRLALAVGVCSLGLPIAPGHAAEPMNCSPVGVISIHDDRSTAAGTFCFLTLLDIYSPGSLTNAGTLANNYRLTNHGGGVFLNLSGGLITNLQSSQLINDGGLQNFGTLRNTGGRYGSAEIINGGALSNYGTLTNSSYGVLTSTGALVNDGGTIENFGQMGSYGSIVNQFDGSLVNFGHLQSSGTLANLVGAQLINQGTLVSIGSLTNMQATLQNIGHLSNASRLTNLMGTITNIGDLDNLGTLRNQFNGRLDNIGSLSNAGWLWNEAGATLTNVGSLSNLVELTNEAGATLTNFNSLSNMGTLRNESGATLTNHGALNIKAGRLTNDGMLTNAATGTLTNRGRFDNGESGYFDNAGTFRNDLVFTNAGTLVSTGTIQGSGTFTQTAGRTTIHDELSQHQITIDGGTLAGNGHITATGVLQLGAGAVLAPGGAPGDIGAFTIDAPVAHLFGSLDLDIDSLANFDSLVANGDVDFDAFGSTWFNFYLGNNTSQRDGDTFDFFTAERFLNFDALNFRCYGLMPGFGCVLNEIDGGLGLQLALNGPSGGGSVGVPEPGELGIMCVGLLLLGGGLGLRRRRDDAAGNRLDS